MNSFIRGSSIATFYSMKLWPGRFDKMFKYLTRGKAVIASGEMYQSKFKNPEGGFGSKLIIELGILKFVLRDADYLVNNIKFTSNAEQIKLMEEENVIGKELFDDVMEAKDEDKEEENTARSTVEHQPTPKKQKTKK